MPFSDYLLKLLLSGSALLASGAATEFAKGAGKSAFEAVKARLAGEHKLKSMALLEDARDNPASATAIENDLKQPAVAEDVELRALAETLRAAIDKLPAETKLAYAVDIAKISSDAALRFKNVEGVKAESAKSKGDMTFEGIKAPPGN